MTETVQNPLTETSDISPEMGGVKRPVHEALLQIYGEIIRDEARKSPVLTSKNSVIMELCEEILPQALLSEEELQTTLDTLQSLKETAQEDSYRKPQLLNSVQRLLSALTPPETPK